MIHNTEIISPNIAPYSSSMTENIIFVSNITEGDIFCNSLVILKGSILSKDVHINNSKTLSFWNKSNPTIAESVWSLKNFRFKILGCLIHGTNHLVLKFCDSVLNISVTYSIRNSKLYVMPVYIICQGDNGDFQAPPGVDNSALSACQRISMGAKLIQCLLAEKLHEAKLGRKTFQLQYDLDDSKPECSVFYSKLAVVQARKMKEGELWEFFARELMLSPLRSNNCKFMAFISCTQYCPDKLGDLPKTHEDVLSAMEAHAALGGGGLALFGSACLHTWPLSIQNVIPRFLDTTEVDKRRLMDDSFYRGTYGGCFATTLGAVCHELGHTFDLGHSTGGIMGRGFDCVNLVFTLETEEQQNNAFSNDPRGIEQHSSVVLSKSLDISCSLASPIKRLTKKIYQINRNTSESAESKNKVMVHKSCHDRLDYVKCDTPTEDRVFWSKSCAVILAFHRWMNDIDGTEKLEGSEETIKFDSLRKVLTAVYGLRVIELRDDSGLVVQSWEFLGENGKNIFILPSCSVHQSASSVIAEDSVGNILKSPLLK